MHADQKLYLVCEFLDVDLKRYMDNGNKSGRPITPALVKVRPLSHLVLEWVVLLFQVRLLVWVGSLLPVSTAFKSIKLSLIVRFRNAAVCA